MNNRHERLKQVVELEKRLERLNMVYELTNHSKKKEKIKDEIKFVKYLIRVRKERLDRWL